MKIGNFLSNYTMTSVLHFRRPDASCTLPRLRLSPGARAMAHSNSTKRRPGSCSILTPKRKARFLLNKTLSVRTDLVSSVLFFLALNVTLSHGLIQLNLREDFSSMRLQPLLSPPPCSRLVEELAGDLICSRIMMH